MIDEYDLAADDSKLFPGIMTLRLWRDIAICDFLLPEKVRVIVSVLVWHSRFFLSPWLY